jgi:hypothetical protein
MRQDQTMDELEAIQARAERAEHLRFLNQADGWWPETQYAYTKAVQDIPVLLERLRAAETALATVRDDMHLEQMTPNPNDPGAYVLGREAERAVLAFKREAS